MANVDSKLRGGRQINKLHQKVFRYCIKYFQDSRKLKQNLIWWVLIFNVNMLRLILCFLCPCSNLIKYFWNTTSPVIIINQQRWAFQLRYSWVLCVLHWEFCFSFCHAKMPITPKCQLKKYDYWWIISEIQKWCHFLVIGRDIFRILSNICGVAFLLK